MLRHLRRGLGLAAAGLIAAGLMVGVAVGHEGRQVGDYHLIVGWQDEPAYEGTLNAVSVRVNRMLDDMGMEMEGDGGMSGMEHQMGGDNGMAGGDHGAVEAASAITVALETELDAVSGVNVRIVTEGFTFAPNSVGAEHVEGEGHSHVYVDGEKIGRVYGPWFYIDKLEPGVREIRVELNANSHGVYHWNGAAVEATTRVTVPESGGMMMAHGTVEAEGPMSIDFRLEPDELGGANLYVTELTGFRFAPERIGGEFVAGEGHSHVYVNGVKVGRMYGRALHLGKMAEGMNEVRVTLNANNHLEYTRNGEQVAAMQSIHIAPGMGGPGYGEDGERSSVVTPPAAGGVLASVPGQDGGSGMMMGMEMMAMEPVEGLSGSLQVEVTHVGSGESRTMEMLAVFGDPGHYVAGVIPTAPGVYEFRVFGDVEGMALDETFVSAGGGGGFDDIRSSEGLQFPVQLPELREVESGVRGALETAQEAEVAAAAAQDSGGSGLAVAALIVGIVGVVLGGGGMLVAMRGRRA